LWVRIPLMARSTRYNFVSCFVQVLWCPPRLHPNNIYGNDVTEILISRLSSLDPYQPSTVSRADMGVSGWYPGWKGNVLICMEIQPRLPYNRKFLIMVSVMVFNEFAEFLLHVGVFALDLTFFHGICKICIIYFRQIVLWNK
jgi:hypothetical protein